MKKKQPPASRPFSTRAIGTRAERRTRAHYRLRGYRVLATNLWIGGYELDLVVRRGRRLVVSFEVVALRGGRLERVPALL